LPASLWCLTWSSWPGGIPLTDRIWVISFSADPD
jgi:hypothetical protein